jgi:hypothetical protein
MAVPRPLVGRFSLSDVLSQHLVHSGVPSFKAQASAMFQPLQLPSLRRKLTPGGTIRILVAAVA